MTRSNTKLILHRKTLSFNNLYNTNFYLLLFHSSTAFHLQILHLSSMMHWNVVADHSSKELLLHMLTLFTSPIHDGQQHPSPFWVHRRCQPLSSSLVSTLHDDFLTGLHSSTADFFTGLHTATADFLTGLHTPMANTNFKLNCIITFNQYNL